MSANKTSNSSPSGKDREHFGKKTHFSNSLTELRNLQAKAPGQDNQDSTTTQGNLSKTRVKMIFPEYVKEKGWKGVIILLITGAVMILKMKMKKQLQSRNIS